jgi:mono/diheme cytochrome c family protein
MRKRGIVACLLACCATLVACGSKPAAETKIPQEEIDRKNPIEATPAAVAEGKRLYDATDCAVCHGKDGDGKGFEAKDANMNVHDWHKSENLTHFTDGELAYIVLNGKKRMPAYQGRETPEQVWNMVDYIRSLPNASAPKS